MILKGGRIFASLLLLGLCARVLSQEWSWGPDTDSKTGPVNTGTANDSGSGIDTLPDTGLVSDSKHEEVLKGEEGEGRQARLLGLGDKLCSLGIGNCPQKKPYKAVSSEYSSSSSSSYTHNTQQQQHHQASHTSNKVSSYSAYSTDPRHIRPHNIPFLPPSKVLPKHTQVVQHQHMHTHVHHTPSGFLSQNPMPIPPLGSLPVPIPRPIPADPFQAPIPSRPLVDMDPFRPLPMPPGPVQIEAVVPDFLDRPGLRPVQPFPPSYKEDCVCVHPSYCDEYDIVGRETPSDIIGLINPRTLDDGDILSNATLLDEVVSNTTTAETPDTESRVRRDLLANTNNTAALAEGRALRYRPGPTGCGAAYVCCRNPHPPKPTYNSYTCGRGNPRGVQGRIKTPAYLQGTAHFGEFPWHAAVLRDHNEYVCGAVLIDARHVLTAAHCVQGLRPHTLKVRLGDWDVSDSSEFYAHVEVPAEWVVVHPDYYGGDLSNDLAVIRLATYMDFEANPHIRPVCLPPSYSDFVGHRCWSSGWGKDAFGNYGEFSTILRKVEVPVVDRGACEAALAHARLGPNFKLSKGFLCAGGEEGRDTCEGDGGGPLVCSGQDGAFQLAGLVSWGIGCGRAGVPGVYVDVGYYVHWIQEVTRRAH